MPNPRKDGELPLFFFSEEARRVITYTNFLADVPSTAELNGNLSASATPVCVLWSAPGGTCLQQGYQVTNISPAAQAYLTDIFSKLPPPDDPNCTGACTLTTVGRNVFNKTKACLVVGQYTLSG